MKKKLLLLTVLVMAFVCLFAIGASAQTVISESNLDESGDIVADILVDLGDNYYLASVDISYTDTNGQIKNGKFYYKTSHWTQRNMRQVKEVYVPSDFDLSQMIYIFDKADYDGNGDYAANELTKLNEGGGGFKMYSYNSYENGTFTDTADIIKSIQKVSYSKYFVKFADRGFGNKATKLTTITYNGREPIEGALIVSPLIDEIFGGSFGGDGSSLTSNSIFTPFTKLIFEDRETSVSFGQYCFTRNVIEEIYFGKGTYNLGNRERIALLFGNDYANGAGATLKTVVLHKEAIIGSGEISWNVGSYDVVVLGNENESKAHFESNNQSRLPCLKSVTYNPCYYSHTYEDDYNCKTALICTMCEKTLVEAKEHALNESLVYENGYLSVGNYTASCTNEGCTYCKTEEAPALFKCLGYSVSESGSNGITYGYNVNKEAVSSYERITGKAVSYGLFAATKQSIGDGSIIDENGNASAGAVLAKFDNTDFSCFYIKLFGFDSDERKNAEFAIGTYIEVEYNGEKKYSYLQDEINDKHVFVKYNDFVSKGMLQ